MQKKIKIQTTYTEESIRAVAKMTYDLFLPHVSVRLYSDYCRRSRHCYDETDFCSNACPWRIYALDG